MTGIEVARAVLADGAQLFRPTKGRAGQFDCKPLWTGSHKGWVILDSFSASAITQVYDALNDGNKVKFGALSIQRMASIAFKFCK